MENILSQAKSLIDELQSAALENRERLQAIDTLLKQKTILGAEEKVAKFREKKALQGKQQTQLKLLLKTREIVDEALLAFPDDGVVTGGKVLYPTEDGKEAGRWYPDGRGHGWHIPLSHATSTITTASSSSFSTVDAVSEKLSRIRQDAKDRGLLLPPSSHPPPPASTHRAQQVVVSVRAAALAEQVAAVRGLNEDLNEADKERLVAVLERLHTAEESPTFQARLLKDAMAAVGDSKYTQGNFAYGSTPFSSWLAVFQSPSVAAAVRGIQHRRAAASSQESGSPQCCQVWGSSSGWLVFFAALTLGIRSIGYELLPSLVQLAAQVKAEVGVAGAEFILGDMLEAPLGDTAVIVLASQCWDQDLTQRVGEKLQEELPEGSLVVDYTNKLKDCERFELVETIVAPVSWNPTQHFFVWAKKTSR